MTKPNTCVAYEISQRTMREDETKLTKAKRKLVVAEGGSCLTCKYTKTKAGLYLVCKLKDKTVSQYNYCEKYISVIANEKEEEINHD